MTAKIRRDTNRQDARFIVEHELYRGAFTAVEDAIISRMKALDLTDVDKIRQFATELQLLDEIKSALTRHIKTGDIADFNEHLNNMVR